MFHLALIGSTELIWIAVILILLFGARKLPELARSMGTSITAFKKGLKDDGEKDQIPEGSPDPKPEGSRDPKKVPSDS